MRASILSWTVTGGDVLDREVRRRQPPGNETRRQAHQGGDRGAPRCAHSGRGARLAISSTDCRSVTNGDRPTGTWCPTDVAAVRAQAASSTPPSRSRTEDGNGDERPRRAVKMATRTRAPPRPSGRDVVVIDGPARSSSPTASSSLRRPTRVRSMRSSTSRGEDAPRGIQGRPPPRAPRGAEDDAQIVDISGDIQHQESAIRRP